MRATEQVFEPTEAAIQERARILTALDGAPPTPGKGTNPDLRGWWTTEGWFLCVHCSGRIFARGCRIQATPVWREPAEPYGPCLGCETPPPTEEA